MSLCKCLTVNEFVEIIKKKNLIGTTEDMNIQKGMISHFLNEHGIKKNYKKNIKTGYRKL